MSQRKDVDGPIDDGAAFQMNVLHVIGDLPVANVIYAWTEDDNLLSLRIAQGAALTTFRLADPQNTTTRLSDGAAFVYLRRAKCGWRSLNS